MTIHLFDDYSWEDLLPLSYTRPMSELRCGIFTAKERAEKLFGASPIKYITQDYLTELFPSGTDADNIYLNGKWIICAVLAKQLSELEPENGLRKGDDILAVRSADGLNSYAEITAKQDDIQWTELEEEQLLIHHPWDIFGMNGAAIDSDWSWLTAGKQSEKLSSTNTLIGSEADLFIEAGAKIEASILNTEKGKIYIGAEAVVMENSTLRGPISLSPNAVVKMAAKIYGPTTIGPYCKVGGELSNVVFTGYSNKGHDGFLGNSVIGEWCNFGADSNNSNLKNNYDEVKLWSEREGRFVKTGLQFCGLIMGDHSKCGINTMFNTGTAVGVSCNIFGSGFPRNFVPSFSWGGAQGFSEYKEDKAVKTMAIVMKRRGIITDDAYKRMINHIFEKTKNQRNYK